MRVKRLVFCVITFNLVVFSEGQKSIYLTEKIIRSKGYIAETRYITTSDGYILGLYRIPFKRHETEGIPYRPVVFLMHGLFGASNSFILLGSKHSLAYNLADAGYDVWMGNARGTKNSRFHTHLNANDMFDVVPFFDFTWEEIGLIDVPEMVNYILTVTGKDKVHYIGHGGGCTAFLVLNSMKPEYNSKFSTAHLLAPVGYQYHFKNRRLLPLAEMTDKYFNLLLKVKQVEAFPPEAANNANTSVQVPFYCTGSEDLGVMCGLLGIKEIMGSHFLAALPDGETGGASFKQLAHYGQNIRDRSFRRWDHGPGLNTKFYGTEQPPNYDIGRVTVNTTFHFSSNDHLVDERDVLAMANDMPNVQLRKVPSKTFQHSDYVASRDVKKLVIPHIIETINEKELESLAFYKSKLQMTPFGAVWVDAWNRM